MRGLLGCSIVVACVVAAGTARADDDVTTLETQLREEHAALVTEDCTLACRALASIRRAGQRICALEPGPRCEEARAKVEDATRRVSESCPDCALTGAAPKDDERRAAQPGQLSHPVDAPEAAVSESSPRRGGCASCSTPGGARPRPSSDVGAVVLAAWAASRIRKKRR